MFIKTQSLLFLQVGPTLVPKVKAALGMKSSTTKIEVETETVEASEAPESGSKRKTLASGDDIGGDFSDIQIDDGQPKKKRHKVKT